MKVNILNLQVELPFTMKVVLGAGQESSVDVNNRTQVQNIIKQYGLNMSSQNDYVQVLSELGRVHKDKKFVKNDIYMAGIEVHPLDYKIIIRYTTDGKDFYKLTKSISGQLIGKVELESTQSN